MGDKSLHSFEKVQPTEIKTAAPAVALLTMPGHGQIRLPVVKSQTAHSVQAELSGPDEYSEPGFTSVMRCGARHAQSPCAHGALSIRPGLHYVVHVSGVEAAYSRIAVSPVVATYLCNPNVPRKQVVSPCPLDRVSEARIESDAGFSAPFHSSPLDLLVVLLKL